MISKSHRSEPTNEKQIPVGLTRAEELEQIVIMTRLELYNRGRPCGSNALRRWLDEGYDFKPLVSARTIDRILARNRLTHGRTGYYPGEETHPGDDSSQSHQTARTGGINT
jgi:hypothetical protein